MRRVAIVHDWLTGMRGGERCLEVFCELFPEADLFTLLYCRGAVSEAIERMRIYTSFIQRLPLAKRFYRYYLPLFPSAIEHFNLKGYDLILSSSHCVAKGVIRPPGALHISYTYTPDHFVAISHHVAERIRRHYGREAMVIHPPVDVERFQPSEMEGEYYLVVSAFAPYKRIDLAIQAFDHLKLPLKIVGWGPEEGRLRQLAGPTVEFLGRRSDEELSRLYARCRALIFPGEEDFGIVPLEAQASGRPVIAYGKGGVLETVIPLNSEELGVRSQELEVRSSGFPPPTSHLPPPTGVFFYEQTVDALIEAVELFEKNTHRFEKKRLRDHALRFDRAIFKQRIHSFIEEKWHEFKGQSSIPDLRTLNLEP